jgi:hypothetical protein
VSSRHWGTLHLVPPGWDPDAEDADDRIVHVFEHGPSHLQVASELWALCDAGRAAEIVELMARAYRRDPHVIEQPEIMSLLRLLDGLEECLVGSSFVDEQGRVPADRIPELKRRTSLLEIDDVEGVISEYAVAAGLSRVAVARSILQTARDEQLDVLFD